MKTKKTATAPSRSENDAEPSFPTTNAASKKSTGRKEDSIVSSSSSFEGFAHTSVTKTKTREERERWNKICGYYFNDARRSPSLRA